MTTDKVNPIFCRALRCSRAGILIFSLAFPLFLFAAESISPERSIDAFGEAMKDLRGGKAGAAKDIFLRVAGARDGSQYAFLSAVYAGLLTIAEEMAVVNETKLYKDGATAVQATFPIRKTLFTNNEYVLTARYRECVLALQRVAVLLFETKEYGDVQFPLALNLQDASEKTLKQRILAGYFPTAAEGKRLAEAETLFSFAAVYAQVMHQPVATAYPTVANGELDLKEFYFVLGMRLFASYKTQPSAVALRTARDALDKAQLANPKASAMARDAEIVRIKADIAQEMRKYDSQVLRTCPVCKRQYSEQAQLCPIDGAQLKAEEQKAK